LDENNHHLCQNEEIISARIEAVMAFSNCPNCKIFTILQKFNENDKILCFGRNVRNVEMLRGKICSHNNLKRKYIP
jgi:hypothetical protein